MIGFTQRNLAMEKCVRTQAVKSILFSVPLALFCLMFGAWPAFAQPQPLAQVRGETTETGSFQGLDDAEQAIPALQSPITAHLESVPLKTALRTIAERAGLGISYSPDRIPEDKLVRLDAQDTPASEALRALLAGTNLQVLVTPQEELIVVQSRASQEGRSAQGTQAALTSRDRPASRAQTLPLRSLQQQITGQVTDAQTQEPIPGVNVVVPNTTVGTATNPDGRYSLDVPSDADSLVFSAISYKRQKVGIDGRTTIDVSLTPDIAALGEVVVVGYGTQEQTEITGSVGSVSAADIANLSVSSFQEALQGQLAGIEIRQTSGAPGSSPQVRVRGTNSITAGTGPLYVIDGLPISSDPNIQGGISRRRASFQPPSQNPLAALNPRDIESIDVLKDASASAIYGSRGSNGVVIVTTKKGTSSGNLRVRYSGSVGVQEAINVPDMMNSAELVDLTIESRNTAYEEEFGAPPPNPRTNEGRPPTDQGLAANARIPERYIAYDQGEISTDTDWLDLIVGDRAGTWSSNISVAGGAEEFSYYLSGGVQQQDGIVEGSAFDRYTLHSSIESTPVDRLTVGADLNLSLSLQDREPANAPYFARPPGIIYSALVHSPLVPSRDPDGSLNQSGPNAQSFLGEGTTSASNPLAIQQAVQEDLDHHRTFGTTYAEIDLGYDLTFESLLGADLSDYTRSFYRGRGLLYRTSNEPDPYAQSSSARSFNWLLENTLRFDKIVNDVHGIDVLTGITVQEERNDFSETFAQNFPIDTVPTISGGQVTDGTSIAEEWSLLSGLARVNYSYDGKYLVSAAFRADKSSRFGPDNRTGIFPSASVGWRVAEESFMNSLPQVNALKVRLSYGQTGNFQIPNYGSFSNLRFENYVQGQTQNILTGVAPQDLGDPGLTWETTEEVNIGLDLGVFDDRIRFAADAYLSTTSDLLLNVSVPGASGYETVLTNIGEVENTGLELFLKTENLTGDFSWSTSFNFSTNQNEVTELGPNNAAILSTGAAGIRHITRVGDPIGSYFGYVVDGVYQSEEELANAPEDTQAPNPGPGDFRFKDVNGDGQITPDDRTVTGSYQPDFTYGITNEFRYGGLDLRVFLQGVEGRDILNLTSRHLKNGEFNFNQYDVFSDRWQSPENPGSGEIPRADRLTGLHGNNNRPSSFQVEDGSYLNIREITLGYTFDGSRLSDLVQQFRVYASGQNLYMSTDYIGFNPMVSLPTGDQLTPGQDYGAYPLQRTYTVGIDIQF